MMKFYKDQQNTVYAYAADGSQDDHIKHGLTLISEEQADAIRNPAKPLPVIKQEKRSEIVKARNEAITGGFPYLGKPIDSDRDSVMAITGAAVAALAAKASSLPYSVIWTCADDSTLTLNADGVLGMAVALAMFADAQHAKARPLKEAIAAETDPEKTKKVKW